MGEPTELCRVIATGGDAERVRELLAAGAAAQDFAALVVAARRERFDCLDLLLAAGAELNHVDPEYDATPLHWLLDFEFNRSSVQWCLDHQADPRITIGPNRENALHVAVRRRRAEMVDPLLAAGVEIDAETAGGKTAWVHAYRRGFDEVCEALDLHGARRDPNAADDLAAVLMVDDLKRAVSLLGDDDSLARSTNPEESRVLPDLAGYDRKEGLKLLLDHGVPIDARGLDGGTALHQAAWFGAPEVARLLVDRGAPLEIRGDAHDLTPLGWACHGSRFSGGAAERGDVYAGIAETLLAAGASFACPGDPVDCPGSRMFEDAADPVRQVLCRHGFKT